MNASDTADRLVVSLWRPPQSMEPQKFTRVYAIVDGARDHRIYRAVSETGLPKKCLFAGKLDPALQRAAPYLVELSPESSFVQHLLERGWGRAWGIFVVSSAPLEELRRHFRRFLRVEDERGRRLFFRYYDPRVLRDYLPTCTAGELAMVFGPVTRYVLEGADPGQLVEYSLNGGELSVRAVAWGSPSSGPTELPWSKHRPQSLAPPSSLSLLRIRRDQTRVFGDLARQRFDRWLVGHVHRHWPDRIARIGDDSALGAVLREAVARANAFGIARSANIARYVNLVMLLGPGFPDDARVSWAGDLLRSVELDEEHKLRSIRQLLRAASLNEASPAWGWV